MGSNVLNPHRNNGNSLNYSPLITTLQETLTSRMTLVVIVVTVPFCEHSYCQQSQRAGAEFKGFTMLMGLMCRLETKEQKGASLHRTGSDRR